MKQITWKELLEEFDRGSAEVIWERSRITYPEATHVVVAENLMLDSSQAGEKTALFVGPNNTYRTPEACEGKWLNDLPSQRQYFVRWAKIEREVT